MQSFAPKRSLQPGDKLASEDAPEHSDRQKECVAWSDPLVTIERKTSGRNHAMQVWMQEQVLSHVWKMARKPMRAPRCLQMLFREMQVKRSRRQVFMSEQHLQRLEFDARFKLVCRVGVAQSMRRNMLLIAGSFRGILHPRPRPSSK